MNLYCMVCRGPMPDARAKQKKAVTCSDKCQTEYRNRRRQERAETRCRLCGRRWRQSRNRSVVPQEHSEVFEGVSIVTH